jgi:hypothetical protein
MELSRAKRYKDEVSKIIQNIGDIKEWAYSEEVFLEGREDEACHLQGFSGGGGSDNRYCGNDG